MATRALVVVEGKSFEFLLLDRFFSTLKFDSLVKKQKSTQGIFDIVEYSNPQVIVDVVKGPKTSVVSCIDTFKKSHQDEDLSKYFGFSEYFAYTHILYDCDVAAPRKLSECFQFYSNTTDQGQMLLSNPCIEAIVLPVGNTYLGTPTDFKAFLETNYGFSSSKIIEKIFSKTIDHIYSNMIFFESNLLYDHLNGNYSRICRNVIDEERHLFNFQHTFSTFYIFFGDIFGYSFQKNGAQELIDFVKSIYVAPYL